MSLHNSCKDCPDRKSGPLEDGTWYDCHFDCVAYKQFVAEHEKLKEAEKKRTRNAFWETESYRRRKLAAAKRSCRK